MTATTRRIGSETRRVRKQQLARRHGPRCGYCRTQFADLRDATLDHIVPHSLYPTGAYSALMLACRDCNHRKSNRFPLSIALLLLRSVDPSRPVVRPAVLPLLARIAHAHRSTPHLPESSLNHPTPERTAA